MSKTRVFVSSTCFDLSQLREDIRNCIIQLGHEPLLSEYPSFPVSPDLGIVENCKKNVRENTDIFFLVVGGRRGSLDVDLGKSVTNIEYETAKEHAIDTFVFVSRPVLNLLPVWEKNPTADFAPHVDYPEVFSFVKNVQADQKWIFPFEKASEITEIIKHQLSVFLKELISRKKEGKLRPLKEFTNETVRARQIALDRPRFWEYLLTEELLRSKLTKVRRDFNDLQRGLIYKKSAPMKGHDLTAWLSSKCNDLISLVQLVNLALTEELRSSWGPPGKAGDAVEILRAVDKVILGCNELLNWEIDLRSVIMPKSFIELIEHMKGWTSELLIEVDKVPDELAKPFSQANPSGQYTINLVFKAPPSVTEFVAEVQRLSEHPEEWLDDY